MKLPGYLARAPNGAIFIQWQRQGTAVTGKLSESYFDQASPSQLKANSNSFTGSISGSSVNLSLDTGDTWSGTLNGSDLTLSYTASDGSLSTLDFHPANAADYNAAVLQVKAHVSGAAQAQAQQHATQLAEQQIESAASTLANDLASVQQAAATVAGDGFGSDLAQMRSDVQTAYKDLQTTLAETDSTQICSDSTQTDSDETQVESDQTQIQSDDSNLQNDISSLSNAISSLQGDAQKYSANQAAVPNYQPGTTPPTSGQITNAVAAARSTVAKARARMQTATSAAAQLVAQAKGYSGQGDAACAKAGG